jgi:hypothetical protein
VAVELEARPYVGRHLTCPRESAVRSAEPMHLDTLSTRWQSNRSSTGCELAVADWEGWEVELHEPFGGSPG